MVGEAATGLRAQAQFHVCSTMSHKPDPKPSQPPAVRAEMARMQTGAAPQPPSLASSATSVEVPSSRESPETVRREGPRATGREGAVAGKGEGGDREDRQRRGGIGRRGWGQD